jgi:signal transduction histidine kinase
MSNSRPPSALESRVKELEKENIELRQRLHQVEKDRTEYLQNVSHQLVAPLNAIKWHIENLTQARIGVERAHKVLRSVYSQATLLVHLAKNFNLMSNLDADHALEALKEPLQEVELCQLLVNLADDFQPMAWDKEVKIAVERGELDEIPPVVAIRPLISQVFSNIIENAVKYSSANTAIKIGGRYDSKTGGVGVIISSKGIPLREDDEIRVFDRGFRSPEAKSKYPAGTGFGLYIARRIIEIHQGTIGAWSTGGNTSFEVRLSVNGLKEKLPLQQKGHTK